MTLKSRPGRGEVFVLFPLSAFPGKFPKFAALGRGVPSPRAAATRMPFLGCVCLFSYVQVLGLYAIQKVTRKKGNSYSEFSTPLTSPPTGDANSYKLITYKNITVCTVGNKYTVINSNGGGRARGSAGGGGGGWWT